MEDDAALPAGPDPDSDPDPARAEVRRVYLDIMARVERHLERRAPRGVSVADATQHIGERLWTLWTQDVPGWKAPTYPQAYAQTLAENHLTNLGREGARWDGVIAAETALDELEVCGGLEPDKAYLEKELQAVLDRLLSTLSPKLRAAWVLCWEGATYEEAGLELGITADTANARVRAANHIMRPGMTAYMEEGR